MFEGALPQSLTGTRIHLVGIKGTGMAALAEILMARGASITGSDTGEQFYTDQILRSLGVSYAEHFARENLPADTNAVVHSAAYDPESHVELVEARHRGLPVLTYPEALGLISSGMPSVAIAGVHGKTTTAALCGVIAREVELPGTVLTGSAMRDHGGRATMVAGNDVFIAETCEYRRGFLSFQPQTMVVTNIEADHLDYFRDREDVISAFEEFAGKLPRGGRLIYCADDPGANELARRVDASRPDIMSLPYGEAASGDGRVSVVSSGAGELRFTVGRQPFSLHVPGRHNALNTAAALLAVESASSLAGRHLAPAAFASRARVAIDRFTGTRRRSEVVGEAGGVTIVDDYAHHPTAIRSTLAGFREFYAGRRIILDFMSHTYSRTRALLDEFAAVLAEADVLILHRIYASARESNPGAITGQTLADAVRARSSHPVDVHYEEEVSDAVPLVESLVRPGDVFVTMGAGSNWQLGPELLARLQQREVPA